MNVQDSLVERLLKVFSLKPLSEIDDIVDQHMTNPEDRYGQRELARWVVEVLFGKDAVKQAENITEILFGTEDKMQIISNMSSSDIDALATET
jgi:tyrosyl-tRNA synthetase